MEPESEVIVIPPAPKTVRGYPSSIDVTHEYLLCFNGNSVVLQPHKAHHQSMTLSHVSDVAAAKISQDGMFLASIDVKGTLIISEICPGRIIEVYKYEGVFPNAKDIDWSADRKKVCIVGEGKKIFAKVISIQTGITAGDIGSVTSTLNSCSFRPERPFKLVMGGDQYTTKCFDGPPYSFVKSDKSHASFIIKIKYSPKGTFFLTGGADRKLVLYDGKTYEKLGEKDNVHGGSIFGLDWISEQHFVTVSSDKLIKIWNTKLEEKFAIETASHEDMKNPKKTGLFLVAVRAFNDLIYAATLSGDVLVYRNPLTNNNESHLIKTYSGPRSKIVKILPFDETNLILLDSGGRVINYNLFHRKTHICASQVEMNALLNGFLVGSDKKRLIILTANGWVWIYEGEVASELKLIKKIQNIEFKNISEGQTIQQIVGLSNDKIILFNLDSEKVEKEVSASEDVTFICSNKSFILAGTIKGKIQLYSSSLQHIQTISLNTFRISNITLFESSSPSLFRCLVGDTCGNMRMVTISPEGFKPVKETMGGHSSVITGAGVSGKLLYTFSMDGKVCVWEEDSLQRLSEIKQTVHGGIVFGSTFKKWLLISGGDLVTKLIPIKE